MDLLSALTTFVRVVETGSFSAVARETGISHSAVTRLVGQLENHFGVRLFQRTTRRLNMTEDGQDLLGYARQLIAASEEMEGALGRQRSSPTGLVRLGVPVAAASYLMPRLPNLLERYPGLSVELVIGDRFGDLIEERLDVALMGIDTPDSSMIARTVGSVARIPVASPIYLERHGAPTHPNELENHTCIIHERGPESHRWRFSSPEGEIDVQVTGRIRANNSEAVRQAALSGYGIARLSELQVVDDVRAARLYRLLADYAPPREDIHLVYPSRRHLPPRVRVVIDYMAENVRLLTNRLADAKIWGENEAVWLV
ncbi:MAG TPA: LysR family transcriptional regulator [Acetobacteraceae bacterium]|nr:LysR family transcriptional regulator [Acetobacteraceae bacterium]